MTVLEIVKSVASTLELDDVLNSTQLGGPGQQSVGATAIIDALVRATNMVVQDIAYTYINLMNTEKLKITNGQIPYSLFALPVIEIVKVSSASGNTLKFRAYPDSIELTQKDGDAVVSYSYAPEVINNLNQEIPSFNTKLNSECLSFGVCAEYLFMQGIYDDARMWESRFKNNLFSAQTTKREIKMPERGWL